MTTASPTTPSASSPGTPWGTPPQSPTPGGNGTPGPAGYGPAGYGPAPYAGPGGQLPPTPGAPVPPAPRRSWFARHKILTGLGALVLVVAMVSVLSDTDGSSAGTTPAPGAAAGTTSTDQAAGGSGDAAGTAEGPAEDAQSPSGAAFPGMQDDDVVGQAGDTLKSKDISVTTTPLAAGDSTLGPTTCTTVTVVNGSTSSLEVNPFDFTLQNPEGAIVDPGFIGTDSHLSSSTLVPQGTVSGDVCFDADTSAGGQYVVIYDPVLTLFADRAAWVNEL